MVLEFRDLDRERLTVDELDRLIGNRDYRDFLNTRNEIYRKKKMKENPPSRDEAIRMMAKEPNLIRRPMILCGGRIVLGYDEEAIEKL
jgi:arsenate reductase